MEMAMTTGLGNYWTPHGATGKTTLAPAAEDTHLFPGTTGSDAGFIPKQIVVQNVGANAMVVTYKGQTCEVANGKQVRIAGEARELKIGSTLGTDYVLLVSDSAEPQMGFQSN